MKKLNKDIMGFTQSSIALGIGSAIGSKMASEAGQPSLSSGFSTMAGFMPIIATATMGKNLIRMTKNMRRK